MATTNKKTNGSVNIKKTITDIHTSASNEVNQEEPITNKITTQELKKVNNTTKDGSNSSIVVKATDKELFKQCYDACPGSVKDALFMF